MAFLVAAAGLATLSVAAGRSQCLASDDASSLLQSPRSSRAAPAPPVSADLLLGRRQPGDFDAQLAVVDRNWTFDSGASCTEAHKDPYATGEHVECCACTQERLGDWDFNGVPTYRCVQTSEPGCKTHLSICPGKVEMDDRSIWRHISEEGYSCQGAPYLRDGASTCANDLGVPDFTSLSMDLSEVAEKRACFAWSTADCDFDITNLARIEFNAEWTDCGELWFAPLWQMSNPWVAPQGRSGEIDYIETCRASGYKVQTAIICNDHNPNNPRCKEPYWALGESSLGPVHMIGSIDSEGTWRMSKCNLERTECNLVSQFPNFLSTVYPTTDGRNNPFYFISDIWNGGRGDAGWRNCGNLNLRTQCRYAISNVKIRTKNGQRFFPENSRCGHLETGWMDVTQ